MKVIHKNSGVPQNDNSTQLVGIIIWCQN